MKLRKPRLKTVVQHWYPGRIRNQEPAHGPESPSALHRIRGLRRALAAWSSLRITRQGLSRTLSSLSRTLALAHTESVMCLVVPVRIRKGLTRESFQTETRSLCSCDPRPRGACEAQRLGADNLELHGPAPREASPNGICEEHTTVGWESECHPGFLLA